MLSLIPSIGGTSFQMKDAFKNVDNSKLYPIQYYKRMSTICIKKNGGTFINKILRDEDAISYIMYQIMLADCYWNNNQKSFIREKYLWYCGRYAILRIISIYCNNKHTTFSLDQNLFVQDKDINKSYENNREVIKKSKFLTNRQREYILSKYDGSKQSEIACQYGVSRQSVNQCIRRGNKNLRKEFSWK